MFFHSVNCIYLTTEVSLGIKLSTTAGLNKGQNTRSYQVAAVLGFQQKQSSLPASFRTAGRGSILWTMTDGTQHTRSFHSVNCIYLTTVVSLGIKLSTTSGLNKGRTQEVTNSLLSWDYSKSSHLYQPPFALQDEAAFCGQ
ncbi:hypothetical protein CDAR_382491 [Caerostris darwini]|uniref:Uncharacterized protein n=1 Tax=Caerostris darwini TaxID=1538125 RepID=A0AAV4SQU0_9ARAC|nr:hypothetical protein CDAR_382491 [Caerostris darwini]